MDKEIHIAQPDGEHDIEKTPASNSSTLESDTQFEELTQVQSDPYGSRPQCFSNTAQEILFVLTTTMAVAQNSFLSGAILCITSFVGKDLNMTAGEVTWISAANSLAGGSFLLFFGRVADLFGRRPLLLASMAAFSIALLIMGFASNAIYMDVFAGISGFASAAAVPPAIGKLGAVYDKPSRRKNRAFACFSAGNPVGFVFGAFIAGVATQVSSWRTTFWTISVIYAFFTVAVIWTCPHDTEQKLGGFNIATFKQFDFLGAISAIAGTGMFVAALSCASNAPQGWRTPYIIVLLIVGVALMTLCVWWQSVFSHPLMPLNVWRDRNFTLLVAILCLGFYGFIGNLFWLALSWQRVYDMSPIMVAVHLLPAAIGGITVNLIAALIMHRVSNKLMMIVASVSLAIASALLSATSPNISYWALMFPAMVLSVVGVDFQFTVTNMYVMSSLPSDQQSIAGGLFNTVSRLSAAVGLGIQTSIYTTVSGGVNSAATSSQGADTYRPYQSTFWVSLVGAFLALFLLPFVTIGRQGARNAKDPHVSRSDKVQPD